MGNILSSRNNFNRSDTCSICLDSLQNCSFQLSRTPCKHVYHSDCLMKWLARDGARKRCPMCQKKIDVDAIATLKGSISKNVPSSKTVPITAQVAAVGHSRNGSQATTNQPFEENKRQSYLEGIHMQREEVLNRYYNKVLVFQHGMNMMKLNHVDDGSDNVRMYKEEFRLHLEGMKGYLERMYSYLHEASGYVGDTMEYKNGLNDYHHGMELYHKKMWLLGQFAVG